MSTMHSSMVVAHSIEIVQEVGRSQLRSSGRLPARLRSRRMALIHHVRCHVQASQGEMHKCGELVPPFADLPEALQVEDEDVWERPKTHLHHALLQLLAMGAFPSVIWGKLMKEGRVR